MIRLHEVQDESKVTMLAESMEANGWQGSPLVVLEGEQLLTGCHRYTAAHRELGWQDSEIPMIDIADVFAEDGKDFQALYEESLERHNYHWYQAIAELVIHDLSDEVKEKYGIDIN